MATVVSNPVVTYLATMHAGGVASGGTVASSISVTFNITSGWEIQLPLRVFFGVVSADPPVNVYRTTDGGLNWDTMALTAISVARVASGTAQASITLPTGQYAIVFTANVSANAGATFIVPTALVVTGINAI